MPRNPTDAEIVAANLLAATFARCAGRSPERFKIRRGANWGELFHRTVYVGRSLDGSLRRTLIDARGVGYRVTASTVVLLAASPDDIVASASWFLERTLGARWFMPGALGVDVARRDRLLLSPGAASAIPGYLSRELAGVDVTEAGREWHRGNRLFSLLPHGHTASQVVPPTLLSQRPEFAPWLNGERFHPPEKGALNWQPNLLAPGFAKFVAEKFAAEFRAHPGQLGRAFGLNDTYRYDQSEATFAAVRPERFFRDRPDYSDLLFKFLNEIAKPLATEFPDRFITTYAYYWTENTPRFPVASTIVPFLTADRSMWFDADFATNDRALIERWGRAGPRIFGLYDYYYGAPFLVPRPTLWAATEAIPYAFEKGARAFYAEATPNWALDGPKPWLAAQLLWDPKQDSAKLLDGYYFRFWKEAAGPMRAFYELCDRQWREQPIPAVWVKYLRDDDQRRLFPPEVRAQLRRHLAGAAEAAPDRVVRQRVKFVSDAFRVTEAFCEHDEIREEIQRLLFDVKTPTSVLRSACARYAEARRAFIWQFQQSKKTSPLAIQTASIDDYLRADPRRKVVDVIARRGEMSLFPASMLGQMFDGHPPTAASLEGPGRELLADPQFRTLSIKKVHPFALTDWVERGPWGGKTEPTEHRKIELRRNPDGSQRLRYSGCNQETLWQWRPAQPGHLYRATVRVKGHVSPGTMVYLLVPFLDKDGRHIGSGHIDRLPVGEWSEGVELEVLVRAPANAVQMAASLRTLYQVSDDWTEWEGLSLRDLGP
ncbi:MAG: DUF4838 domain-containing protein [Opitutae bacterium]|nr:DUF4838 domain-containing protein [Opitutae bacterium]